MSRTRFFIWMAVASFSASAVLACAPAPSSTLSPNGDAGSDVDNADTGVPAPDASDSGFDDPSAKDGGLDPDAACAAEGAKATLTRQPVDIVLLVDNSGSMMRQIESVQGSINTHFAKILDENRLDYRVIVIGKHGDYEDCQQPNPKLNHCPICIEAPLSGIPAGGCDVPPSAPVDTSTFFHYSYRIRNNDAVQILLHGFSNPDELGNAPNGWSAWLREEAFKSFIVLTDGRVNCAYDGITYNDGNAPNHAETTARTLDETLRQLAPEQFGALDEERNYRFYSIVGMAPNDPATAPYPATAPLVQETCSASIVNAGLGYQAMSRLTGGTRFPLCNPDAFDSIFRTIAKDVIAGAPVDCEFPIPEPPPGEKLDLKRVAVEYTPGDSDPPMLFGPVANAGECLPKGFYIDEDEELVHLCPETCAMVQGDDAAKINVLFDCEVEIR